MEFAVYILCSVSTGENYCGHTNNLILRLKSHNEFGKGCIAKFRPWIVVHLEFFETKAEAMKGEKYYKGEKGHYKKIEMLNTF